MSDIRWIATILIMITLLGCSGGDDNENVSSGPDQPTEEPTLPSHPGEAGKLTLDGIDSDSDGVRDDLQIYIVETYPPGTTRKAMRQIATAYQSLILTPPEENGALDKAAEMDRALNCLFSLRAPSKALDDLIRLKVMALDTLERAEAFLSTDRLLSHRNFESPPISEWSKSCSEAIDEEGK